MSKCIVCKNEIKNGAQKCVSCNSWQNYKRHFDFGNTSLSLLIAALSVIALTSDNIHKLINAFTDQKATQVTGYIINAAPDKLIFFFKNDGPGAAIIDGGGLCSIWPTQKSETLYEIERQGKEIYIKDYRYPKRSEIVNRYIYSYSLKNDIAFTLESGKSKILEMPINEVLWTNAKDLPSNNSSIVKSYCTVSYKKENGEADIVFDLIDPLGLSYFSLDQSEVQSVIKNHHSKRHSDKK